MRSIRSKFAVIVGAFALAFSMFLFLHAWSSTRRHVEQLRAVEAELALEFDLAIREYVAEHIRPEMDKRVEGDEFIPEAMSTSFVARRVFEKVRRRFPDYAIKFSSDNPRNPANRAGEEELRILEYFREHPEATRWTGRITMEGQRYLVLSIPRKIEESCLRCHGDVEDAPASLVARYGSEAGFDWNVGDVIAMDLVGIPTAESDAALGEEATAQIIAVALGIALLFAAIILVFRLVVGRRLARITAHFQRAAGEPENAEIVPIEAQGKDEIGVLAEGYNAVVRRLRAFHESLERRVEQRTAELEGEILRRRASEMRFREFAEMLPQTVCEVDLTGRLTFVNRNALEMFGYTDEDFRGGIDYWQTIVSGDRPRAEENFRGLLRGEGRGHNEYPAQRKDGTTFPAIIYSLPILHDGRPVGLRSMVVDITDRKQAEVDLQQHARALEAVNLELARAKRAAEAATRAKSEFLANMSHEIRTPMTAILGFADFLKGQIDDPECVTAVETVRRNGEYLLGVINDVLDLSKIEAGELEIERVACSPVEIANGVASLMAASAATKGLTVKVQTEGPVPESIASDRLRLRQILMNLVGNAVKFTERGGIRVTIAVGEEDGARTRLRVAVADTGIGMAEDQLQRIFQPFVQADASASRRFGGTGLGLTISKRLARLLGGDLTVTSRPGEGSTFTVTVAAGPLEGVPMIAQGSDSAATEPPASPQPKVAVQRLACRVLLVEDGLDNQRLIRLLLEKAGAHVEVAEHGAEACEKAIEAEQSGRPFDVILMDMQMPVMDGYEATRRLRQAGYRQPIIALTAHAMAGDRQRSLEAGCDDYTTKPIDRGRLVALIAQYSRAAASPGVSSPAEAESSAN